MTPTEKLDEIVRALESLTEELAAEIERLRSAPGETEALREALDWLEETVNKVRKDESAEAFGKAEGILFAVAHIRRALSQHVGGEG